MKYSSGQDTRRNTPQDKIPEETLLRTKYQKKYSSGQDTRRNTPQDKISEEILCIVKKSVGPNIHSIEKYY